MNVCQHPAAERGVLLLGALLAVSFAAILALFTWKSVQASRRAAKRIIESDKASHRATEELFEALSEASTRPPPIPGLQTISSRESVGDSAVHLTAYRLTSAPALVGSAVVDRATRANTPLPIVDLDSLLGTATPCTDLQAASPKASFLGQALTPGALIASGSCILRAPGITERTAIHGNIVVTNPLKLPSLEKAKAPVTIAAAGFIESSSPISVAESTLIVAGGDLLLSAIVAERTSRTTVVSVTGRIVVHAISPTVQLHAIAAEGVTLPPTVAATADAPAPPFVRSLILGARRGPE
ncbi:MAG: hypothetical protein RL417_1694 [Pseudomonadota bacterium]|jgi:hypothetical protein